METAISQSLESRDSKFVAARMSATLAAPAVQYRVQSDLNKESLPQSNRDPQRKVWWMNAICASVLVIGFFLTKEPAEFAFQPVVIEVPMQVEVFTPEPPPQQQPPEETPEEVVEEVEVSVIQPTVVAADPSKVAFAVEVRGPTVTSSDLRKVAPPPAFQQKPKAAPPSGPVLFRGDSQGFYPPMSSYPAEAQKRRESGEVMLLVVVGDDGSPLEISTHSSSGSVNLDRAARDHVRRFWRWPPGSRREYHVPFLFKLD